MIDRERIEADVRGARLWRPGAAPVDRLVLADHCEQLLAALAAAEAENARLEQALVWLASAGERVPDWRAMAQYARRVIASRPGEQQACERCHGDGVIPVGGTSVNPHTGMLGPDPQAVDDAVCPDCGGTGVAP